MLFNKQGDFDMQHNQIVDKRHMMNQSIKLCFIRT